MFRLFRRRKNNKSPTKFNSDAQLCLTSIEALIEILQTTDIPTRFFKSYDNSLELCSLISVMNMDDSQIEHLDKLRKFLIDNRSTLICSFIDRISSSGAWIYHKDDMISYRDCMPGKCYDYFLQSSGILYDQYIYCSVTFGDERLYSYICEFEEIDVGDIVVVPTGKNNEEKIATVVDVSVYRYDEVPYPLNKTKIIISKIG